MLTGRFLAVFLVVFLSFGILSGQNHLDSLNLDKIQAENILKESDELIKKGEFDSAFHLLNKIKLSKNFEPKIQWQVYNQLGFAFLKKGEFRSAIENFNKSLEKLEKKQKASINVAKSYHNLGMSYQALSRYDTALIFHQKALRIRQLELDKDNPELADSYNSIGAIYQSMGEFSDAKKNYENALAIKKSVLGKNDPEVAKSLSNLGYITAMNGDLKLGIIYAEEAVNIFDENYGKDSDKHSKVFNLLGILNLNSGNYKLAGNYFQKALSIDKKIFGNNHLILSDYYNNLGLLNQNINENERALGFYFKSLELRKSNLDENHPRIGTLLFNIGNVFFNLQKFEEALNFHEKADTILSGSLRKNHPYLGNVHNSIGNAYLGLSEYEAALNAYNKSLNIKLANYEEDHILIGSTYFNFGNTYREMGNYKFAEEFHQKCLDIRKKMLGKNNPDVAEAYKHLGKVKLEEEKFDSALQLFDSALIAINYYDKSVQVQSPKTLFSILNERFHVYSILCNSGGESENTICKEFYQESLSALKVMENLLTTREFQYDRYWADIAANLYNYSLIANRRFKPKDLKALKRQWIYNERSKSLLLYQSLQESNALHFAGIPDSLLEQEYDLRVDITYYDKKRQEKLNNGLAETDTAVLAISSKLFDIKQAYDNLKAYFEKEYPNYYQLKYNLSTVSVEEVQQELLEPDQAMIEYFVGDSSIFIFVVTPENYAVHEVKRDFPLKEWVEQMRDNINQPHNYTLPAYAEAASNLYQKLVATIPDSLPERLIIVPDGILGYIPFEALLTETPTDPYAAADFSYLLHTKQISYNYSATLLREMQQKKHRQMPTRHVLALAPYAEVDTILTSHLQQGDWLANTRSDTLIPLPGSRLELDSLQNIMATDAFYGKEATEQLFTKRAADYRILHLSTHGKADARVGDYSYLAFYPQLDSLENELLYVRDLYNLQLNADLVVLSACETGTGELQRGEGIISLARAFAYAGAKSIATTLWKVSDQSTQELMVLFYRHLDKGLPKDQALRQAKLDYLKEHSGTSAAPFYWAAIIGIGDMRPIP